MLLYLSANQLTDELLSTLSNTAPDTPVLLTQNAVYLYDKIKSLTTANAPIILEEDAAVRGIPTTNKSTWTMNDWVQTGSLHVPWIKLS